MIADGTIVIANDAQNQDLFWALRGGGGGTFGVVTRATLLSHPFRDLRASRPSIRRTATTLSGRSSAACLLPGILNNPHRGEQITVNGGTR